TSRTSGPATGRCSTANRWCTQRSCGAATRSSSDRRWPRPSGEAPAQAGEANAVRLVMGAATDVGRVREGNEDAFLVDDAMGLMAVADGMGGHRAGEVASVTALEALRAAI